MVEVTFFIHHNFYFFIEGKAIIKMHIQKIFVILAFNNQLMETLISLLVQIPVVGVKLESPVRSILGNIRTYYYYFTSVVQLSFFCS